MEDQTQNLVDELIEKHKGKGMISTYCGVPIEEFSKEELIAMIKELIEERESNNSL